MIIFFSAYHFAAFICSMFAYWVYIMLNYYAGFIDLICRWQESDSNN